MAADRAKAAQPAPSVPPVELAARAGWLAVLLALLGLGVTWLRVLGDVPYDDAYIYFRYAQNIAEGTGAVFNIGDWVEGYSSFAWMVMLIPSAVLGLSPGGWATGLGVLSFAGVVGLLLLRGRIEPDAWRASVLAAGLYTAVPPNAFWATSGLETAFYTLLLVLPFACLPARNDQPLTPWRSVTIGLIYGFVCMGRVEGVAYYLTFLGLMTLRQLVRFQLDWRQLLRLAAGLPMFAFYLSLRVMTYGWPLPNPYYAKVGHNESSYERGAHHVMDYLEVNAGGLVVLVLVLLHGLVVRRTDRKWQLAFLNVAAGCFLVTIGGGNNLPGWRYLAPLSPFFAILIGDVLARGFAVARTQPALWRWPIRTTAALLGLHLVVASGLTFIGRGHVVHHIENNRTFFAGARFHGKLFKELFTADQSIALNAMPFVAYFYEGEVIDMLGLVDDHISHRKLRTMGTSRPHGHEKGDGVYVFSRRPTALIFAGGPYLARTPLRGMPTGHTLRYLSDQEIGRIDAFAEEYEPYNLEVAPRQYVHFYKHKSETLNEVDPAHIEALYAELQDGLNDTEANEPLRRARGTAQDLLVTRPVRAHLRLREMLSPLGRPPI